MQKVKELRKEQQRTGQSSLSLPAFIFQNKMRMDGDAIVLSSFPYHKTVVIVQSFTLYKT